MDVENLPKETFDVLDVLTKSELMIIVTRLKLCITSNATKKDIIKILRTSDIKPKPKSTKLRKAVRDKVWDEEIKLENGIGKCWCCEKQIDRSNFECGHIISRADGGDDTIQNLKPICGGCNKSIGTKNMADFIKEHGFKTTKNEYRGIYPNLFEFTNLIIK